MYYSLERGLETLKSLIEETPESGEKAKDLQDFLVYEARLRENINRENLYEAVTPDMRVERTEVIMHLNRLAPCYPQAGKSVTNFNDLCEY